MAQTIGFSIDVDSKRSINDLAKLQGELERLTEQRKRDRKAVRDSNGTNQLFNKRLTETELRIKKTRKELNAGRNSLLGFNKATGRLSKSINTGLVGAFKRLGTFAAASLGIFGTAAAARDVIKRIASFEQQLARVRAITGATADEFERLQESAIELGRTSLFTATEVGQLQEELAKLGFTTKEIVDASGGILDLSTAFQIDLAQAAAVTAGTLRGFGLEASQTREVVDLLAESFASSGLDINKFQESIKLVAPAAKATGRDIKEVTALLGVLADNSLSGSIAGTQLNRVFIELNKRGLTLEQAIEQVATSSNGLATATDLVGDRGAKALQIFATQTDRLEKLRDAYSDSTDEAERLAKITGDTLTGDFKRLESAYEGFILSLDKGDSTLSKTIRGITQFAAGILNTSTRLQKLRDIGIDVTRGDLLIDKSATEALVLEAERALDFIDKEIETRRKIGDLTVDFLDGTSTVVTTVESFTNQLSRELEELDKLAFSFATSGARGGEAQREAEFRLKTQQEVIKRLKEAIAEEEKAVKDAAVRKIADEQKAADAKKAQDIQNAKEARERNLKSLDQELELNKLRARLLIDNEEILNIALARLDKQFAEDKIKAIKANGETERAEVKKQLLELEILYKESLEKIALETPPIANTVADFITNADKEFNAALASQDTVTDPEKSLLYKLFLGDDEDGTFQAIRDTVSAILDDVFQLQQNAIQRETDLALDKAEDRQQRLLSIEESRLEQGLINQEQFEAATLKINESAEKKREEIQRAAFEREKNLRLAEVAIDTAAAIIKSILVSPATLGLPFSGFAAAQGLAQAAVIKSQTFADGGFTGAGTYKDQTGHKVAGIVHDNEYVVPKSILGTSEGSSLVGQLEGMRTGKGFANGGFTSGMLSTPSSSNLAFELAEELRTNPPVVSVTEIDTVQESVRVVESDTGF